MVDTAIENGSLYITTGTVNGNTITHNANKLVKIHVTKVTITMVNEIQNPSIPVPKGDRGSKTPHKRIIDLKRISKIISTQKAPLEDEPTESANTKRDNLISMAEDDGVLTVVWGETPYQTLFREDPTRDVFGCFITKMEFNETGGLAGDNVTADSQPERSIIVDIQLAVGKDI